MKSKGLINYPLLSQYQYLLLIRDTVKDKTQLFQRVAQGKGAWQLKTQVCSTCAYGWPVYQVFLCVCFMWLQTVVPSTRTDGFCGVEHLNAFAQNLRPEVGHSRHHLSVKTIFLWPLLNHDTDENPQFLFLLTYITRAFILPVAFTLLPWLVVYDFHSHAHKKVFQKQVTRWGHTLINMQISHWHPALYTAVKY